MNGILASRPSAVVASHAIAGDTHMIECRIPIGTTMANIALACGLDMIRTFAPRRTAVVATAARTLNLRVVDGLNIPTASTRMTRFALIGGLDMRCTFTDRCHTMTA